MLLLRELGGWAGKGRCFSTARRFMINVRWLHDFCFSLGDAGLVLPFCLGRSPLLSFSFLGCNVSIQALAS
jgi:hypothetical protein